MQSADYRVHVVDPQTSNWIRCTNINIGNVEFITLGVSLFGCENSRADAIQKQRSQLVGSKSDQYD